MLFNVFFYLLSKGILGIKKSNDNKVYSAREFLFFIRAMMNFGNEEKQHQSLLFTGISIFYQSDDEFRE